MLQLKINKPKSNKSSIFWYQVHFASKVFEIIDDYGHNFKSYNMAILLNKSQLFILNHPTNFQYIKIFNKLEHEIVYNMNMINEIINLENRYEYNFIGYLDYLYPIYISNTFDDNDNKIYFIMSEDKNINLKNEIEFNAFIKVNYKNNFSSIEIKKRKIFNIKGE
jgi:hypothetical protein